MADLNVIDIFFIEWDKHVLYGWERRTSVLVIDAIIRGIEAGDEFPPVYIHRINDEVYELAIEMKVPVWGSQGSKGNLFVVDGGHSRAVGHFIADAPLKCILLAGRTKRDILHGIPISEIEIGDDNGEYRLRKWASRYR